ncbi:SDR family NAD(P)-dependent oxidoreductase [Pseudomonas sp. B21-035]|uniref:SDR family NAD(P)-dependent oxidoreductase n=1 Tax=Pseudomonas sp. B21-035 TaxID=2895484 RepID=UPI00216078DB|nr:SDR family oxidoreductase [Pseudomonas sp. B21-035]UVL54443.1 SDR family oxidoreductase [Pseudomonas sp. B21-035]
MTPFRTVLITGGARGLGLAYARALAQTGAQVVISDLGTDREGCGHDASIAEGAAELLRNEGHQVIGHSADLSDEQACRQLISKVLDTFGGLDALIHNAGWVGYQNIEDCSSEFIERALAINVHAPLWLSKHAWPALKASGSGRIVLTTSDRAMYLRHAQTGLGAYAAGKMAQLGIMNALAAEGAEHGIAVNAISPVARTRMWGQQGEPEDLKPEWVVPGVLYLASADCQDSGYILRASNGQFCATRFEENPQVDYPRELRGVSAGTVREVRQRWQMIKAM